MKISNSTGCSMNPWGTPPFVGVHPDIMPLILPLCVWPCNQFLIRRTVHPSKYWKHLQADGDKLSNCITVIGHSSWVCYTIILTMSPKFKGEAWMHHVSILTLNYDFLQSFILVMFTLIYMLCFTLPVRCLLRLDFFLYSWRDHTIDTFCQFFDMYCWPLDNWFFMWIPTCIFSWISDIRSGSSVKSLTS